MDELRRNGDGVSGSEVLAVNPRNRFVPLGVGSDGRIGRDGSRYIGDCSVL